MILQTVCIATEETKKNGYNVPEGFIGKYGYFFTPEQLNKYTRNIIEQALETAAEKVDFEKENFVDINNLWDIKDTNVIDKQSITNTFEETYKKFEV